MVYDFAPNTHPGACPYCRTRLDDPFPRRLGERSSHRRCSGPGARAAQRHYRSDPRGERCRIWPSSASWHRGTGRVGHDNSTAHIACNTLAYVFTPLGLPPLLRSRRATSASVVSRPRTPLQISQTNSWRFPKTPKDYACDGWTTEISSWSFARASRAAMHSQEATSRTARRRPVPPSTPAHSALACDNGFIQSTINTRKR